MLTASELKPGDVDLLRLGFVHGAQFREAVGLLILHRDAGLSREGIEEGFGDGLLPRAAIAEIGDGRFGGLRGTRCNGAERREQGRSGRGLGERVQKLAPGETTRAHQELAVRSLRAVAAAGARERRGRRDRRGGDCFNT